MFGKCFSTVANTAGGKPLTDAEKRMLQAKFTQAFLESAENGNKSAINTLTDAVQIMRDNRLRERRLAEYRKLLQAAKLAELDSWQASSQFSTKSEAVTRILANHFDMNTGRQTVESLQRGITQSASRPMRDVLNYIGSRGAGFVENSQNAALFVRELFGEATGDAGAAKAARQWKEISEALRSRYNRAGGDIGQMVDWIMPQGWSARAISSAWKRHPDAANFKTDGERLEASREIFVQDMMRTAARSKYIDFDTGLPMTDAQIRSHLEASFNAIATDGATKSEVGGAGVGSISNRQKAHRQIHIADADGWLEMSQLYGAEPVQSALVSHIRSMASNIALIETMGPNPAATVDFLIAKAVKAAGDTGDAVVAGKEKAAAVVAKVTLKYLADQTERIEPRGAAKVLAGWRNLNMLKLSGAFVTNLADIGAAHFQAIATGQSNYGLFMQQIKRLSARDTAQKHLIENAGLVSEIMQGRMYRHMRDVLDSGWTGAVSDAVMRASLMPKLQEWAHESYSANLSNTLGRLVKEAADIGALDGFDRKFFEGYGFNDAEFRLLKLGQLDKVGSFAQTMLTANTVDSIPSAKILAEFPDMDPERVRSALRDKVLGAIYTETTMGVLQPSAKTKALMTAGTTRGTLSGEIMASVMQFKSFPIAQIAQHLQRFNAVDGGLKKFAYGAGFLAATTLSGAIVVQIKELLNGKNPRNVYDSRFWVKSMLQGGALGIYGDMLFASSDSATQNFGNLVAGPVAQDIGQAMSVLNYPIRNLAENKEVDADKMARDAVNFVKAKTPGALLWYTRSTIDHAVLHDLQEDLNPGYLRRMESRARKDFGQSYWWEPGEALPTEAPDFSETWQE